MQIVIDIPEEEYRGIIKSDETVFADVSSKECMLHAIKNGVPLPKGHGKIADMDEVIKCIEEVKGEDATWAIALIEWACSKRTFIEADKVEESPKELEEDDMRGNKMTEIVIKIDDKLLNRIKYFCEVYLDPNAHTMSYDLMRSVQNGIRLPKGHGRLIDADKTISKICGSSCGCHLEECGYDNPCYSVARISSASTIIESDKEKTDADSD